METVTRSKHDALLFVSSVHMVYKCNVTFIAEYICVVAQRVDFGLSALWLKVMAEAPYKSLFAK